MVELAALLLQAFRAEQRQLIIATFLNDVSAGASGFNFATENYVEHTFTGDHVTWTRNTSLNNTNIGV